MNSQRSDAPSMEEVNQVLDRALSQLRSLRESRTEPIAIVGVGCRFPDAPNPEAFWDLLSDGRCAIGETPPDRWDGEKLLARIPGEKGRITANRGGFLKDVDKFDASFFNLTPREARLLDPQQRLLLEIAWETLENAGIPPESTKGSQTGVFVGICTSDYLSLWNRQHQNHADALLSTGNAHGSAAGRLSYFLDWHGPSLAVDTACSSSLVAVHLAVQSLRNDECQAALVAGVNLILTPELSLSLSQAGMLSPEGLCKAFSDNADGFVRGEGCGAILLKRLSRAKADGDSILCQIRGSAVNQDGRSLRLTAPNGQAQQAVIKAALADARLGPEAVSYVEAHGTGTALGDPIELAALESVFGANHFPDRPLMVGSVKTNLGHLEGAAGIAGLMKTALALSRKTVPAHLHCDAPSSKIHWGWPVQVAAKNTDWQAPEGRSRVAGISSFGFGGTNAHVILEEAASMPASSNPEPGDGHWLKISAKTKPALRTLAARYAKHLEDHSLAGQCYSSCIGRADFTHRLMLPATDVSTMRETLTAWIESSEEDPQGRLHVGTVPDEFAVAWYFPGTARIAAGFGRDLYESHSVFRELWDQVDDALTSCWPRSLGEMLWQDRPLSREDFPVALCALQLILSRLWLRFGVKPRLVFGAGIGELAAGSAAGIFSWSDALRLAANPHHIDRFAISPPTYGYRSPRLHADSQLDLASLDYWRQIHHREDTSFPHILQESGTAPRRGLTFGSFENVVGSDNGSSHRSSILPALGSGKGNLWEELLDSLAELYVNGAAIEWKHVFPTAMKKAPLPTYPFERQSYWLPRQNEPAPRERSGHPFLKAEGASPNGYQVYEMDLDDFEYLAHHQLRDLCLCPLTAFLEMALAGAVQSFSWEPRSVHVSDLQIRHPVLWRKGEACPFRMTLEPASDGLVCRFAVCSAAGWSECATCTIHREEEPRDVSRIPQPRRGETQDVEAHYKRCEAAGLVYSGPFRCVKSLANTDDAGMLALGVVERPSDERSKGYHFHPAFLDGCLQVSAACFDDDEQSWIPSGIARYVLHQPPRGPSVVSAIQCVRPITAEVLQVDLVITDADETLIAEVDGLTFRKAEHGVEQIFPAAALLPDQTAKEVLGAPQEERPKRLEHWVKSRLAGILEIPGDEIDFSQPLIDLGLDSLMAVELRHDLNVQLGVELSMEELLDVLTPGELFEKLLLHLENRQDGQTAHSPTEWVEGVL